MAPPATAAAAAWKPAAAAAAPAPAPTRLAAAAVLADRVCPITCEPIVEAGITALGRAYEYAAISKWLEEHDSEPVTNELLPHSGLIRVPRAQAVSAEEWAALQQRARSTAKTLCPNFGELSRWADPASDCRLKLVLAHGDRAPPRPEGDITAALTPAWSPDKAPVVFVDASGLHPTKRQSVKGAVFFRCNFEDATFARWDFGRVRFIECNLAGTTFKRCVFRGDETLWADCSGTPAFRACQVEAVNAWVQHAEPERVRAILRARGLPRADVYASAG